MPVICANCGEELLGAVNRCWRCGQHALSTPDAASVPPVRRTPVSMEQPAPQAARPSTQERDPPVAEKTSDTTSTDSPLSDEGIQFDDPAKPAATTAEVVPAGNVDNREEVDTLPQRLTPIPNSPRPAVTTPKPPSWKNWIAFGGILAGLLATGIGWLTPWMLILAVVGVVCGILGLTSRRKALAIVALLLCMLGVSVSSVRLAYDVFYYLGDRLVTPVEPLPADDTLDPFGPLEPLE